MTETKVAIKNVYRKLPQERPQAAQLVEVTTVSQLVKGL